MAVYDDFRISVLRVQKSNIMAEIEQHNLNMSEVLRQGNYEVKASSIQDSASELQIVLVLTRRPSAPVAEAVEEAPAKKAGRPKKVVEESAD